MRLGRLARFLRPTLPSGASEDSTASHHGREAEAKHVGTAQTGGVLKGRLHGEDHSGAQPEGPPRAQLPPHPRTRPTSLEVTLSRSLVSSTSHSSARIACSICSCSEGLGPNQACQCRAPSPLCRGTSPQAPSVD